METNFKVDVPSFALGFNTSKKNAKKPILTELTVTENGVYDEPMIEGELDFSVGKTAQFKETYTADDFPEEYQGEGEAKNFPIVSTADCVTNIANINGSFGITVIFLVDGNASRNYTYMDARLALEMGSIMGLPDTDGGWYEQDVAVGVFTKMVNPPSIVIADEAIATGFASVPFLFTVPSTPADGWNKVTVNVAGDIVDVPELPTENIEEGKIYRVTTVSEGSVTYYISDGATSQTLEELADSTAGPGQYIRGVYTIVDELPENPPDHDGSNMTVPVYVIRETGEGFVRTSDGLVPLIDMANMVFQVEYSYMGIVNTVGDMTQAGYYAIMTSGASSTTYGIPDAHPVKRLVDGAWVELT